MKIGHAGNWTEPISAPLDTGAVTSLVQRALVESLRVPYEEGAQDSVTFGGTSYPIVLVRLDVSFLRDPLDQPERGLVVPNAVFGVWDFVETDAVLIGQHDVLERLQFLQRNYSPFEDFVLRTP